MPRGRPRVNGLTPRQIAVLQLLVEGLGSMLLQRCKPWRWR